MTIKQAAIDRTRPANTQPGTYQPEPDILTWLAASEYADICGQQSRPDQQRRTKHRHNPMVGINPVLRDRCW